MFAITKIDAKPTETFSFELKCSRDIFSKPASRQAVSEYDWHGDSMTPVGRPHTSAWIGFSLEQMCTWYCCWLALFSLNSLILILNASWLWALIPFHSSLFSFKVVLLLKKVLLFVLLCFVQLLWQMQWLVPWRLYWYYQGGGKRNQAVLL